MPGISMVFFIRTYRIIKRGTVRIAHAFAFLGPEPRNFLAGAAFKKQR